MSQDSQYDQQKHRILFGGTVIDNSDPELRERIRVKPDWEKFQEIVSSLEDVVINGKSVLNDEKTDIKQEFWYKEYQTPAFSDPFVFLPFLPVQVNLTPENNDYVHLLYYNWAENQGRKNQFYVRGPISNIMSIQRENANQTRSTLASGPNVKGGLPLKKVDGEYFNSLSKGVFAEPQDFALYSKGRSDIILKDSEVLIRSRKTPILKANEYPIVNTKRTFLQLSNFDTRTVPGTKKTITQNQEVSEQIRKLVEYEIYYGLETPEGPFWGNVNIYNLPGRGPETLTTNFTQQSTIEENNLYTDFSYSFSEITTMEEVAEIINKVISGLNDGQINLNYGGNSKTLNVTDRRFPFFYRPSLSFQRKKVNGTDIEIDNVNTLISLIQFPKSQKLTTPGAGLISKKGKYGVEKTTKRISYTPNKVENGDFGYAVLGSEKIFIISNESQIYNGTKVELNSSEVYGINEPTLSGNYYNSTNSMVRGEALKDLLSKMIRFLLNHKHLYHREPPFRLTHETTPLSKEELNQEWKLFDTKVLNQNIRIN